MKSTKIIYWATTGLVSAMMLFSASQYITNPAMAEAFHHAGFPDFFRMELAVAKILGALALIIPQAPNRVKEWAYAGFGIVFISASFTHYSIGDAAAGIITPLVFMAILVVSYIYWNKSQAA